MSGTLSFANPADEEWRGTKPQRDALRQKFGGKCAYCGGELGKTMHADHMEPVRRVHPSPWNDLEAVKLMKPERNTVGNMMPACAPCNIHKGGYPLEAWRAYIQRSAEIVRKQTSTFRAGERFGVIAVNEAPIVFHFERAAALSGPAVEDKPLNMDASACADRAFVPSGSSQPVAVSPVPASIPSAEKDA